MCICLAFNYSVERWEIACGIRKPVTNSSSSSSVPVPVATPVVPSAPTPAPSPETTMRSTTEGVNVADWEFTRPKKHTCPAGKYYIGDLCYVLGDDVYEKVFGGHGYEDGLYTKKNSNEFFFVAGTAYGDGCYPSSDGKEFCVDAGIIGICPISCMRKDDGGGQTYTFTQPVECKFRGGVFEFVSGYDYLKIDTAGYDENEE